MTPRKAPPDMFFQEQPLTSRASLIAQKDSAIFPVTQYNQKFSRTTDSPTPKMKFLQPGQKPTLVPLSDINNNNTPLSTQTIKQFASKPSHSINIQERTNGDVTGTPIRISSICGMLSQHTHWGPVLFQCPQLTPFFQKKHQQSDLLRKTRALSVTKMNGFPSAML